MVGIHGLKLILGPPPRGYYTYLDDVSGKVTLDTTKDEKNPLHLHILLRRSKHQGQERRATTTTSPI
jgi:hypothetical protein